MPATGCLSSTFPARFADSLVAAFCPRRLHEGQNVVIEYRCAEGLCDKLLALAADIVRRKAEVIAAFASSAPLAAKLKQRSVMLNSDPPR